MESAPGRSPGSLVPVGKDRRSMELLHILIYFRGPVPSFRGTGRPFHGTSGPGIDGRSRSRAVKDSTCCSMEIGYLPVTFCERIFSVIAPLFAHRNS